MEKNFHVFSQSFINMQNGAILKCNIPKKISKGSKIFEEKDLINEIDEELATYILRENSKMCYNTNYDGWYYKICPFNSANQVLGTKKKTEDGLEYTESNDLGKRTPNEFNLENYYRNKTGDNESINIPKIPYIVVNDKVKFFHKFYYNTKLIFF
jgi:hypothetical protein